MLRIRELFSFFSFFYSRRISVRTEWRRRLFFMCMYMTPKSELAEITSILIFDRKPDRKRESIPVGSKESVIIKYFPPIAEHPLHACRLLIRDTVRPSRSSTIRPSHWPNKHDSRARSTGTGVETEPLHKREQRNGKGVGLRYDICRVIRRR